MVRWMVVISVCVSGCGFVITYLSYHFVKTGVDIEPEVIAERNARIKAWYNDVTNSTHVSESTTKDTASKNAIRSPGWTKEVRSMSRIYRRG